MNIIGLLDQWSKDKYMKYINKRNRRVKSKLINNGNKYRSGDGDELGSENRFLHAERSMNPILSNMSGMKGGENKIARKIGKGNGVKIDNKIDKIYDLTNMVRGKIK